MDTQNFNEVRYGSKPVKTSNKYYGKIVYAFDGGFYFKDARNSTLSNALEGFVKINMSNETLQFDINQ